MSAVTDSKSSQRLQDLSETFLINTIAQKSLYLAHKRILEESEQDISKISTDNLAFMILSAYSFYTLRENNTEHLPKLDDNLKIKSGSVEESYLYDYSSMTQIKLILGQLSKNQKLQVSDRLKSVMEIIEKFISE